MMGILLGWLSEGEQTMLVVLSAGSVMGSIAVFFPAARLYRSWKTARALDKTSL